MLKVLVAMSGGVDSSAAAALLMENYEVAGATFDLFESCGADSAVADALAVCGKLGIRHYTMDFRSRFRECVSGRFADEYYAGRTPNPCVDCNREIKFGEFLSRAVELGYDCIATGHYARAGFDESSGRYYLRRAADATKDQSYVLYSLTQEKLSRVLFPLGELDKAYVREYTRSLGLCVSSKPDSQDICFVPDGDHAGFISRFSRKNPESGDFLGVDGEILGRHKGITAYTVGQRRGIGISAEKPFYVIGKDAKTNSVIVGDEKHLYKSEIEICDANWIMLENRIKPFEAQASIRYRARPAACNVTPLSGGRARIVFETPQRAPAAGQAAVIYLGDCVAGGGTIC